jgi:hypothetical protein
MVPSVLATKQSAGASLVHVLPHTEVGYDPEMPKKVWATKHVQIDLLIAQLHLARCAQMEIMLC